MEGRDQPYWKLFYPMLRVLSVWVNVTVSGPVIPKTGRFADALSPSGNVLCGVRFMQS